MTVPDPLATRNGRSPSGGAEFDAVANANVYDLFAAQAERQPDAIAIIGAIAVTYRDLAERASAIAENLIRRNPPDESPVGVLMHRDPQLVATLLAVMKAGFAYLPLDPDDPPDRTQRMVAASNCQVVIGSSDLVQKLGLNNRGNLAETGVAGRLELVDVNRIGPRSARAKAAPPTCAPGGNRLAYVLFTSGSTGEPKGIEVEHRSVVNLLLAARDMFRFTRSDRYLAATTVAFDISVAELFLPLITGGSLVLRDRSLLMTPELLAKEIALHDVTVFQTGPSVWSTILAEVTDFPRLRVAITTGEAVAPSLADRLRGIADLVWNLYGPTEATVWATGYELSGSDGRSTATMTISSTVSAPIGTTLANVGAKVVDEDGHEVALGETGELWLSGVALARGYCRNPELTRQRFNEGGSAERWYRTGDLVAKDDDGILHYFGRNDDQIKIRGVRIEPMEVESALLSAPGVAQASATWLEIGNRPRSLVAAIVTVAGAAPTTRELHDHMAGLLPGPMIPSQFVFCDSLPLSPAGKIDRKAIRTAATAAARASDERSPSAGGPSSPMTPTERRLLNIWTTLLGVAAIAPEDHFFTVGGDSLIAVSMMLAVEEQFSISIPVRALFEYPTLARLAARIDEIATKSIDPQPVRRSMDPLPNRNHVFPLVQTGQGRPVFFDWVDLNMARPGLWTLDCPLYAVSHWAYGTGFVKAKSVEELAAAHLAGIKAIQPHGPYRIAGYSFGGLVAIEMAQQLQRGGDTVEMLFLLDPSEPDLADAVPDGSPPSSADNSYTGGDTSTGGTAAPSLSSWIRSHLAAMPRSPRGAARYVSSRVRHHGVHLLNLDGRFATWQWLNYQLVDLHGRHPRLVSARLLPRDRWPAFWYASVRLGRSYQVRPYEGRVVSVFTVDRDRSVEWQALLRRDHSTFVVDSHHLEVFSDPALAEWTAIFENELREG